MMSIHLDHYRNGKDTDDDDVDQLQKSFHSNTRLRGFADVTPCFTSSESTQERTHSYYLLCGLGIGTLNMWHFAEHARSAPEWKYLYSINTNGNTVIIASFMPRLDSESTLQLAARCEDKNMRVWNLGLSEGNDEDKSAGYHVAQGHYDLQGTKDVTSIAGTYAYGIAPTGEPYRFQIPSDGSSSTPTRTFFDMERHDMIGGSSSSKSRRATIIMESIFASDDGQCVVAVSAEGIFYYTKSVQDGADGGMLKIIGRNSSLNTQFKTPPMKVYRPVTSSGSLLDAVMAVVTNPQSEEAVDDGAEGYVNVDMTETWAARWMVRSQGQDCWVCGIRNISHWPAPQADGLQQKRREQSAGSTRQRSQQRTTTVRPEPEEETPKHRSTRKPSRSATSSSSKESTRRSSASTKNSSSKPSSAKKLDIDTSSVGGDDEDDDFTSPEQLQLELIRYKERYNQIVTEWQRRLKGERQMRRLWKQRETEFESQLQEATSKLDAAEKEVTTLRESQRDAETRFIFEKLKAEQQSSVKAQYEQLCEKMQERMTALEHQQRVMETTTRTLLQEVDRHVQHSKQSVKSLVDRQQNECVLCKEHPAVTAIVPCGHLCFCEDDAETYRRNFHSGDQVVCPICQREMISMLRIY
ncbi:hypothetical protein PINS_up011044 [Pythium insidiosum]|nr:hypothetical protein PINS_up011044 [Pythium insidiosum]